jgi:glucose-6-phosphate-specific signal transduction histidine kinase
MDVNVAADLDSDNLPDDYKTCIYRVVQEALHNCARHSQAKAVRIKVQQEPERLLLTIQDDGLGFDAHQTKGLGLLGIQERAARLGGVGQIHSAPGAGTIVSVELPFQREDPNPAASAQKPGAMGDSLATAQAHSAAVGESSASAQANSPVVREFPAK